MLTRNVNLTEELDRFVLKKVKTGRYENASEVVLPGVFQPGCPWRRTSGMLTG